MASVRALAAANNAEWCDVVCRAHGLDPVFDRDAWTSRTRTPPFYPDAVTLVPELSVPELLDRVDGGAGCSIKDSFASLDLTAFGFRVLFDAAWIMRALRGGRSTPSKTAWRVVRDPDAFETWKRAWQRDVGVPSVLTADLLCERSVFVLAGHVGDTLVAGAVLTRTEHAAGISNFFADPGVIAASWDGCLALVSTLFADAMLVGYESGDALDAARAHGFSVAGPLRVWVRDR
jgi:hypothetical protein